MDGLGLLGGGAAQAQDRVRHERQSDHGEDENQEKRAVLLSRCHGCCDLPPLSTRLVCDVAGFCGDRDGSGSGAAAGGTGQADLRIAGSRQARSGRRGGVGDRFLVLCLSDGSVVLVTTTRNRDGRVQRLQRRKTNDFSRGVKVQSCKAESWVWVGRAQGGLVCLLSWQADALPSIHPHRQPVKIDGLGSIPSRQLCLASKANRPGVCLIRGQGSMEYEYSWI